MTKSVEQLILALSKEYEIYANYLALAKRKKEVIVEGNIKELDDITKKEQDVIASIGKIDEIRTAIIGNVLYEQQIPSVESITDLSNYLEEPEKTRVLEIKHKLESVLTEIANINKLNSRLIQQSLDYINFNMNLVSSLESTGSTYSDQADEKDLKKRSNLFDAKV
ncbi:flagellar protein FlgN [Clostridiaceae bacterium 35-E11]